MTSPVRIFHKNFIPFITYQITTFFTQSTLKHIYFFVVKYE